MFNDERITNLEHKLQDHISDCHRWEEDDYLCYIKKDIITDKYIVSTAKILKVIPLESYSIGDSPEELVIEDLGDGNVTKIGSHIGYSDREEAELVVDIKNMKIDIANIKNHMNK